MSALLSADMHVRSTDSGSRSVDVVASSASLDSHDSVVEQKWDLTRYSANPVVLFSHNQGGAEPPIGFASNVRVQDGALRARVTFVDGKASPLAERVWQGVLQKSIRGISVGFRSRSVRTERRGDRDVMILSENELVELSVVPVPSNPDALIAMRNSISVERRGHMPQKEMLAMTVKLTPDEVATARAFGMSEDQMRALKVEEAAAKATQRALASLTFRQARAMEVLGLTLDEAKASTWE